MKKTIKQLTLLIVVLLSEFSFGQDSITDPLSRFNTFIELGVSANLARVNTNYVNHKTGDADFMFLKNKYLSAFDGICNFGWLIKPKDEKLIMSFKTGLNAASRSAVLTDSSDNKFKLLSTYLIFPAQYGYRFPLNYNRKENRFYKAVEVNAGIYVALPVSEYLIPLNDIDTKGRSGNANYLKFGFIGEITFSALNNKGNGHKFGLRATSDFSTYSYAKNSQSTAPFYHSVGVFYYILNRYR